MPPPAPDPRSRGIEPHSSSSRTLIHIDDTAEDAQLMREAFAESGADLTYHWIEDGTSALEYIKRITSDIGAFGNIFLIDVNMPLVDGIEIVRQLRSHLFLRHAPIVMLSTSNQQYDRQSALMHGAVDYLVKPSHFDDWLALARHLDQRYP